MKKIFLTALPVVLTIVVLFAVSAQAEPQNGPHYNVGFDSRTVDTTWSTYPGTTTEELFKLKGLRGEWQYDFITGNIIVSPGLSLGYFFSGAYDYWKSNTTGSGGSATAYEFGPFVDIGFRLSPKVTLFGRLGFAHLTINAQATSGAPAPYKYSFDITADDLFLSPGVKIELNEKIAASLQYRTGLKDIDVSTDYTVGGHDPNHDNYTNSGLQLMVDFKY